MDFEMTFHGYYCLAESNCDNPFLTPINRPSISGAAPTDYCGIEEDFATCEAVRALQQDWRCSGTEGMCGPFMQPEVPVPGGLCRQVGVANSRCTYRCAGAAECLSGGPGSTCGGAPPPTWCGG